MTDALVIEVQSLLVEILGNNGSKKELSREDNIATDLGIDSIQMINFFLTLENKYNIAFDYESIEIENFTIGRCCDLINKLQHQDIIEK
ncbi:acyl carrier protein [Candidatus Erwinia dacicola]|nr:acyl carrier protein [Candidatus Erwinia dacicola]